METIKNNLYVLKLLFHISKGRVICIFLQSLFDYASWVFYSLIFVKFLLGSLEQGRSFGQILLFLVVSASVFAIPALFGAWYNNIYCYKSDADIYEKVNRMLYEKATSVELECYEDTEFYNRFTLAMLAAAEHKTVVFISHRLSSTVMADRIYMFEVGKIIEVGNHEELMRQNGKYAEMFRLQAEKYGTAQA